MADSDSGDTSPVLPRPKKNFQLFKIDESTGFFPKQMFEGKMGDLPIFMSVNVGYDPEDPDPFMYPYESQEVLFAYKTGAQTRVLLQDSHRRTLSLPLHSTKITFHVGSDSTDELTVSQIVASHSLPVQLRFARPLNLDFQVEKAHFDHTYFGDLLLTKVYDEPFYWCLAIHGSGKVISDTPRVLPRNLKDVCFSSIIAVKGAADPASKVNEFIVRYTEYAKRIEFDGDPFFQEMAFVSQGPEPVETVEPYIEQNTFIPIQYKRRPAPEMPQQEEVPSVPPRNPVPHSPRPRPRPKATTKAGDSHVKRGKTPGGQEASPYSALVYSEGGGEEHVYNVPTEPEEEERGPDASVAASAAKTQVVRPLLVKEGSRDDDHHHHRPLPPLLLPVPPLSGQSSEGGGSDASSNPRSRPPGGGSDADSKPRPQALSMTTPPALPPPRTDPAVKEVLDALSIEDVSVKLKELGLGKYAKKFRKNRIDGVLLQKLTESTVRSEFNMSQLEFILLNTFIREGHIPKHSEKKPQGVGTLERKLFPFNL